MNEQHHHYALVARAIRYLVARQGQQPSLAEVAATVHLSPEHFQRVFRKWAGVSPKEFTQYLTLETAKAALRRGQSTLATAHDSGLSGTGRLHDLFVKIEACTPGEWRARGAGLALHYGHIDTPFGLATVAETERGVSYLSFCADAGAGLTGLQAAFPRASLRAQLGERGRQVADHFSSWRMPATPIALDLRGTPFQVQVWRALLRIPVAELATYGDVATRIGRPGASRATGSAIGKNPIAYLIPCHRVIRADAGLGNYRWHPDRKADMIAYEQARARQ